jgi:hypothetical protein
LGLFLTSIQLPEKLMHTLQPIQVNIFCVTIPTMASRSLTETSRLAWEIASKTAVYEDYLLKNGMPTPSHGLETPASLKLPPSILEARDAAIEASTELQFLLRGPMGSIHAQTYQVRVIPETRRFCV